MGLVAHVSDNEKLAIINDCALGISVSDICTKYNRSESTIRNIKRKLRTATAISKPENIKTELIGRGYKVLNTALTPTENVDKALRQAPIAVQVLKGLGEFAGDNSTGVSISFTPGALDWAREKVIGSSSTADIPTPPTICSGTDNDNK